MPPNPISAFIFTPFYSFGEIQGNLGSLIICFIPRILVGAVTGSAYKFLSKLISCKDYFNLVISSIFGSFTNTLGVMIGIWIFFGEQYFSLVGHSILLIIGSTILTSGIPEAIIRAILAPAVCKPIKLVMERKY